MNLTIRPPKPSDTQAILKLVTELNIHQGDPTEHFTIEKVKRDVLSKETPISTLLAELNHVVVGYVFFHPSYESGYAERGMYICDLYVVEQARNQGIARKLIGAVAQEAKKNGNTFLWWASKDWNKEAQKFYEKLGASTEPAMAHALTHEAFEKLVQEEV